MSPKKVDDPRCKTYKREDGFQVSGPFRVSNSSVILKMWRSEIVVNSRRRCVCTTHVTLDQGVGILSPTNQRHHRTLHAQKHVLPYRGTSHTIKRVPPGPCRRPMPRVLGGSWGRGGVLMGEVPLYACRTGPRICPTTVAPHPSPLFLTTLRSFRFFELPT